MPSLSEVKTYKVTGSSKLGFRTLIFSKELRGLNEKEVIEKFYDEICSKNKLKRKAINIQMSRFFSSVCMTSVIGGKGRTADLYDAASIS